MKSRFATILALVLSLIAVSAASAAPEPGGDSPYYYLYQGQPVRLTASDTLVAIGVDSKGLGAFQAATDWERDALSDSPAATEHRFVLYRGAASDPKAGKWQDAADTLATAKRLDVATQPVFELGGAIQIPSNEVIVAFDHELGAEDAWDILSSLAPTEGLLGLKPSRPRTFVVTIEDPEDGRAFAVSRVLAALPEVAYAEPNFVVIHHLEPPRLPAPDLGPIQLPLDMPFEPLETSPDATSLDSPPPMSPPTLAPVGWTTLISEGFEAAAAGWSTLSLGTIDARGVVQGVRKRSGNYAIYMTGGGTAGVLAPGPYPNDADALLLSPTVNLAPFEEAYFELWFYAKYEDPGSSIYDYGMLVVRDNSTSGTFGLSYLAIGYTGDLTVDPTTQNGWRRVLFRIPPAWRKANIQLGVYFHSDSSISREGLYIDDVRVVGTTNVDVQPIGNDTYGARGYELKNSGQIAGLGGDANDLNAFEAWGKVAVSPQVVVAVVDTGVDLGHPDLNLVTGYDAATGQPGGGPKSSSDNHGTACAGNVGAKRNNGIGTIGTAPGVKIMPIHWGDTLEDLARGIDLAVQHGAKVLSNSWGWSGAPSSTITTAIQDALAAGRTVVFAAGNGPDRPPYTYQTAYPCNLTATTNVICVGASSPTDEHKGAASSDGEFSWGSSYLGAGPDVVAPGPWSYTTDRRGTDGYNFDNSATGILLDYTYNFNGTSSSTPKVAGIAALMLSRDPTLAPAQVKSILRKTATDIGAPGVDDRTGAGRVDALAAVNSVPRFTDVPSTDWAWQHIQAIANAGITTGCGAGLYCPLSLVSRAEMAAFLLRGIHGGGYSPPAPTGTRFSDVPATYWAAGWIEQLATEGVTLGCGGGRYCPESSVTRAEMAVFLLRSKYGRTYQPPPATGTRFLDVPLGYWAAAWIEKLAVDGVTTGCGGGNYCPENSVTRAEMAVFLARSFGLALPPRP